MNAHAQPRPAAGGSKSAGVCRRLARRLRLPSALCLPVPAPRAIMAVARTPACLARNLREQLGPFKKLETACAWTETPAPMPHLLEDPLFGHCLGDILERVAARPREQQAAPVPPPAFPDLAEQGKRAAPRPSEGAPCGKHSAPMPWSAPASTRPPARERPYPAPYSLSGRATLEFLANRVGRTAMIDEISGRGGRRSFSWRPLPAIAVPRSRIPHSLSGHALRSPQEYRRAVTATAGLSRPVAFAMPGGQVSPDTAFTAAIPRSRLLQQFQRLARAWWPHPRAFRTAMARPGENPYGGWETQAREYRAGGHVAAENAGRGSEPDWVGSAFDASPAGSEASSDLLRELAGAGASDAETAMSPSPRAQGPHRQVEPRPGGDSEATPVYPSRQHRVDAEAAASAEPGKSDWVARAFAAATEGPGAPVNLLLRLAGTATAGTEGATAIPAARPAPRSPLLRSQAERTPSGAPDWDMPFSEIPRQAAPAPEAAPPPGARQGFYPQAGSLPLPAAGQPEYRPPLAPPLAAPTPPTLMAPQATFDAPTPAASASLRQQARSDEAEVPEDLDELAAKIRRILDDEARRHGILS